MKLYKVTELLESNLTIQDLSRNGKDGLRGDVLVNKIRNSDPFTIKDKDVTIINSDEILPKITIDEEGDEYDEEGGKKFFLKPGIGIRYGSVLLGDDDNEYKLNDIKKTTEFGSSSGSSLGTSATRDIESLQCFFLSYRQSKGSKISDLDISILQKMNVSEFEMYLSDVYSESRVTKDTLRLYTNDWSQTFIKTSNALYDDKTKITRGEKSDFLLSIGKSYNFYQISSQSGVCLAIKKAFRDRKQSVNISKWNPADIWIVNKEAEYAIIKRLEQCKNIKELNYIIDINFDSRDLIGVSLKKVTKNEKITMIINKVTPLPRYKFANIILSSDPLSTASLRIQADRYNSYAFGDAPGYMTIRSFGGYRIQNISGEISGKTARQGKISLTQINKILTKYGIKNIPMVKDIKMDEGELKEEILLLNNIISNKYKLSSINKEIYKINKSRLLSKYQSLSLALLLMDNSIKYNKKISISDSIIEDMFHYALSIKYDKERTPKYVRVIDNITT